jgi:Tol biopolymer transport system component
LLDDVANIGDAGGAALAVSDTGTVVYLSGSAAPVYPVVWLDSSGQTNPLLARPDAYDQLRVSPEGRRLAVSIYDGKAVNIYTYDMPRDRLVQLTFDDHNQKPVWTRDGAHLVYGSVADKTIKWIRADGAGEAQRLLEGKNIPIPWSFSPDGRYLAYHDITVTSRGDYDLWILPVDASDPEHVKPGTPEVFLKTPAREGAPAFSPDGRWISYFSDESGEPEVYVRPFHRAAVGKWLISTRGGSYSYWSRDGRALYYLAQDQRIMVVEYTATGESFTSRTPRVWSETPIRRSGLGYEPLDLAPDGKRFAILPSEEAAEGKGSVHATFLLNFLDELQRRLP